jgi:hypothetical protein
MKIYIRATTENHDVFEMSTHTSYYDNFLNEKDLEYMRKAKNRDGEIVMMTPDEYFEYASEIFHHNSSPSDLVDQRSDKYTDQYVKDMKNGDKFPLCYLNFADPGQEGLHRMLAAKRAFGPDVKYPVLVVTVYDQNVEDEQKLWKDIHKFEHGDFYNIVEWLASHISHKYHVPPENLVEIAEKFMQSELDYYKDSEEDFPTVEFTCTIWDYGESGKRLCVYLTSFNGYDIDDPDMMQNSPWFDDMFDYVESTLDSDDFELSDDEIDKLLEQDLEIDDILDFLKNR